MRRRDLPQFTFKLSDLKEYEQAKMERQMKNTKLPEKQKEGTDSTDSKVERSTKNIKPPEKLKEDTDNHRT
uniref:Anaphase-promoting complex subunit CDC26 n=1 Tax=Anopheles albimanus TaxID=7167 RepID=A0A182FY89_ANOAL